MIMNLPAEGWYKDPPYGEMVPSDPGPEAPTGADVHRSDEACEEPPYDKAKARRAVWDVIDQSWNA
jgi:hypothetical protein